MAYLGNPGNTIEALRKYNFNFQKRFGQNFLIDANILEKIIRSAENRKIHYGAGCKKIRLIPVCGKNCNKYAVGKKRNKKRITVKEPLASNED